MHLPQSVRLVRHLAIAALALCASGAFAAEFPAPKEGDFVARDFKFHTGEIFPEIRLHYTTIGDPRGIPVVVLHGTGGSAKSMLGQGFAGELFGAGQPLDAAKYFIVLPDSVGHGRSAKPSDGLKAKFPKYDYDDMVEAQHRLLTEGLGIKHVRLIIGNSMGGMQAWMWGEKYPDFADTLVPMASQPTAMAARNWMLRRMMIESIRQDPAYADGNYTSQPHSLKLASTFYGIATSGGTLNYQNTAASNAAANKAVDARLAAPMAADANDFVWAWSSSADYDPSPGLERIKATVLAINAADDERNPPETGVTDAALKRVAHVKLLLIPASKDTRGHGTTANATFYKAELKDLLDTVPRQGM